MTLSVIIPNYNHGRYLKDLIPSLLSQSRPPEEIIVIDDGSTDDSVKIMEAFAEKHPSIRFYQNEKNRGVIFTLNRAVDYANGDYLAFPSADNFVLPGMYEKSMHILEQFPTAGLCCSDPATFYEESGKTTAYSLRLSREPIFFPPAQAIDLARKKKLLPGSLVHTAVVRKKALLELSIKGESFLSCLKWHCDFFAVNGAAFLHGVCYIPEVLAIFRADPASYSRKVRPWAESRLVYQSILDLLQSPGYSKLKPAFKQSLVLTELSLSMIRVLLSKPSNREFLTPFYLKRSLGGWLVRKLYAMVSKCSLTKVI